MLHRLALLLVLVAFVAGTAYGTWVDGYAYLEGETDHSGIKVVCTSCVNPIPKFTDPDGHYGPWLIAGGREHSFKYSCECFCTDTQSDYIPLFGSHTLPPITLERCEIERFCGGSWAQYPYYPPGTEIWFSRHEGKHLPYPTYPIEWWYANFHLTGKSQREYGAFVGFFKLWEIVPLGMRLFAISDLGLDLIYTDPKYGQLLAEDNWLDLEFIPSAKGDWWRKITACNGLLLPFAYRLHATGKIGNPMRLDVDMYSQKAPLIVGGDGYIEIGDGFTYYYSHSRVEVSGTLVLPSGFEEDVEGYAWIDHQWGDFLSLRDTVTWEWFSIQLDDTSDIMVADAWLNGELQESSLGGLNLYKPDCSLELFKDYTITQERFWPDPGSPKIFATQWTITVPAAISVRGEEPSQPLNYIELTVTADYEDQVFPLSPGWIFTPRFWEGSCSVSGTIGGRPVSGKAYAELTHSWEAGLGPKRVSSHDGSKIPGRFFLSQNHPNPFNATTTVYYQLPVDAHVKLEIYNLAGQKVATVVDEKQEAGYKSVRWDASKVSSGLYFYRLTASDYSECRRMMLVK